MKKKISIQSKIYSIKCNSNCVCLMVAIHLDIYIGHIWIFFWFWISDFFFLDILQNVFCVYVCVYVCRSVFGWMAFHFRVWKWFFFSLKVKHSKVANWRDLYYTHTNTHTYTEGEREREKTIIIIIMDKREKITRFGSNCFDDDNEDGTFFYSTRKKLANSID